MNLTRRTFVKGMAAAAGISAAGIAPGAGFAAEEAKKLQGGTGGDRSISHKMIDIIEALLGVDRNKVVPEASFVNDLGADSLDLVEIILAMEKEFGVNIPDEEAVKITTVQDAINCIMAKLQK